MTPHEVTQQGLKAHQAGRLAEAEALYAAALKLRPDFHSALHLMGLLEFQRGNLGAARDWLSRAIIAAPPAAQGAIFASRGEALLQLESWPEALSDFERALALGPASAALWNNRGLALNALKRFEEALESYASALQLMPQAGQVHNNRGDTLRELRRFDEALASFERALALDPADWGALNNRAIALTMMGRMDEALESYGSALALHPGLPAALHARGNLLWSQKSALAPALADLDALMRVAPDFPFARGSRMRLALCAARWSDFEKEKTLLDEGVRSGRPVVEPFIYLSLSDRPEDLQHCARAYARARFPAQPPLWKGGPRKPGRIRVGYVCGEFRTHAMFFLMVGLYETHDREQFEIFAFDNGGGDSSPRRARFEAGVEHLVDIRGLSDRDAARRIRQADIDILVDLNGYSGNQRLNIFAHRPARVQASWLGYPGTLGAPYMDYILADRIVIPPYEDKCYDEKIAWLPHCYQINDRKRAIGETGGRAEAGLPDGVFVFANFNHVNKLTPDTFSLWMRILKQVPGSILWLLRPDPLARENLIREAEARDVDSARLVFAESLSLEKHLARLGLADLFLDGLPYGAHTTASDALWAGLPLITCRGKSFAGRVAASLLHAVGLPELVAEDEPAFEGLALRLAREPGRLTEIRQKLAATRDTTPLFDTERQTRAIETAWKMMLERATPESFAVPSG
jgi:predicted O-linked N-acetylglucosamine transferase (SPINDLY family)